MAMRALKFGLVIFGLGALSFAWLFILAGGLRPCANGEQITLMLLGMGGTGTGALICVVSLVILLFQKISSHSTSHEPASPDRL
jgi:hypothetical protein